MIQERPALQIFVRLAKLLSGVHYDRPLPGNRFSEGLPRYEQKPNPFFARLDRDVITAVEEHQRIVLLKQDIGELEAKCDLQCVKPTGPQVDTSYEAQLQRKSEEMLSIFIAAIRHRRGQDPSAEEVAAYRQTLGLATGKGCEGILPAVPDESMEDSAVEEPEAKAARKAEARAEARARGDDMSGDEAEEIAEGWAQVGPNSADAIL